MNPTIFNIRRWVPGTNDSSTKRLMFQELSFFIFSSYVNYIRINRKYFLTVMCSYIIIFIIYHIKIHLHKEKSLTGLPFGRYACRRERPPRRVDHPGGRGTHCCTQTGQHWSRGRKLFFLSERTRFIWKDIFFNHIAKMSKRAQLWLTDCVSDKPKTEQT